MILNDLAPARLKQQPLPPRARPLRLEGSLVEEIGAAGEAGEGADEKTLHKDLGSLQVSGGPLGQDKVHGGW
jgi:hypothetical protein